MCQSKNSLSFLKAQLLKQFFTVGLVKRVPSWLCTRRRVFSLHVCNQNKRAHRSCRWVFKKVTPGNDLWLRHVGWAPAGHSAFLCVSRLRVARLEGSPSLFWGGIDGQHLPQWVSRAGLASAAAFLHLSGAGASRRLTMSAKTTIQETAAGFAFGILLLFPGLAP